MATDPRLPVVLKTANQEFLDALIRHQIFLMRFSGQLRNQAIKFLDDTERDIARQIRERLRGVSGMTPASVRRMESVLKEVRELRSVAWDRVDALWLESLRDLMKSEVRFVAAAVEVSLPVVVQTTIPATIRLDSLLRTRPFEGQVLRDWAKDVRRSDLRRMENQIRMGMFQGETGDAIARRIVGTAAFRGRDGVFQITRNNAESLSRTAVNTFSNAARSQFFEENKDLVTEEAFVATLDARTTAVCRANDGKRFKRGEGPMPPLHWGCRSLRVAVLSAELLGERPMKPVTERQLLGEFGQQRGLGRITSRDMLPRGTRGDFDRFASRRTRELIGRVPASTNYNAWLKTQSRQFQDEVLGKTRAELFRKGGLSMDRFVNRAGDELTLRQLARLEADAFRAAGLDVEAFLRRVG